MNFGVFGTGIVGTTLATKLVSQGHKVIMGARSATNEKAAEWVKKNGPKASQGTFEDAALNSDILLNCTKGEATLQVLKLAGEYNLDKKILIDVSNPLDFSKGMPPTLTVCNTDSLGEQIQKQYPLTMVVKTLNTMAAPVMTNPRMLPGFHVIFLCGNDANAKEIVGDILITFGWKKEEILDLGDITSSRGTEMLLPLWLRIMGTLKSGAFNFNVVK
ncbi:MAG: NAD(P)-binding domain-containing protein [Ignavibacteriaceae bacterium]|nr:NAD(P)-binding domain-containing protein [Ignavibacteriaceae bacterium]